MKLSPKVRSGVQNPNLIWKTIPGHEEYEISEYGDLRKGDRYIVPQRKAVDGRKYYQIYRGGRVYLFYAHQLVALAFIGQKPFNGAEVCHNDGFLHNNHYSNLRYDTPLGNAADVFKHRLQMLGHSGFGVASADRMRCEADALIVNDEFRSALRNPSRGSLKRSRRSRPPRRQREIIAGSPSGKASGS